MINLEDGDQIRAVVVLPNVCGLKDNYNFFVQDILQSPHVVGICEVKIRTKRILGAALLCFKGKAYRLACRILINTLHILPIRRKLIAKSLRKKFFQIDSINSEAFYKLIETNNINLVIHSRTRRRFLPETLSRVKYGCINIHNGILPWQRGVKSDLRAFAKCQPTGFSLHLMEEKIDCGPILTTVTVDAGQEKNYDTYTHRATKLHASTLITLLNSLDQTRSIQSIPQQTIPGERVRSSLLSVEELKNIKKLGIQV
jgi:methionyl-tRNA formyltransferase